MSGFVPEQIEWWLIDLGPGRSAPGFWRSTLDSTRPRPAGFPRDGGSGSDALDAFRSAMREDVSTLTALADPAVERRTARELGAALLPKDLLDQLVSAQKRGATPILRIHATGRVADVPWETLAVDDRDTRLVEVAQVRMIPPPTDPSPAVGPVSGDRSCVVVDPRLGTSGASGDLAAVVDRDDVPTPLAAMLARHGRVPGSTVYGPGRSVGRERLRTALLDRPARLVYFGHVTSTETGDPALDSIHLSDDVGIAGHAPAIPGHRPLSALDLMVGPPGVQTPMPYWPMPPRVALIGCGSGREQRHREPFGLVSAAFATGAQLVTATRWPLLTDFGLEPLTGPGIFPTSRLLAAVDAAHAAPDPFAALCGWKRGELAAWRAHRVTPTSLAGSAHSPLIWGALADFEDPAGGTHPWPETPRARDSRH